MRFRYASHSCLRMSNVQVTCVNDGITYGPRVQNACSYADIRPKFCACSKLLDVLAVRRRIPAYFSVLITYARRVHNVFDVRLAYIYSMLQILHTLGIRWLNRQGVTAI